MATSATSSVRDRTSTAVRSMGASARAEPVLVIGISMIVVQLALRAWALSEAWFQYDDFAFIQRSLTSDLNLDFLTTPYSGHFMPAGFLLTWINAALSPLGFQYPAIEMWLMQALASFGFLRLLIHMFGRRLGVLPPLAVYLFCAISLPASTWWAAGINQLPIIVALIFGLHTHVTYLRTRETKYAVRAVLWTLAGLAFSEKALLNIGVFGLIALLYFCSGHIAERCRELWATYRPAILLYAATTIVYIAYYQLNSINFDASTVGDRPLGELSQNMVAKAFGTGIVGGPVTWISTNVFSGIANPTDLTVVISWLVLLGIFVAANGTRTRSKRAWLLVVAVLAVDLLLVATGRAFIVGPAIGLEYRYQTEIVPVAALALALAFMPLLGAKETVEQTKEHPVIDSAWSVTAVTSAFVCFALYSSWQFASLDLRDFSPETYYTNFDETLAEQDQPLPVADGPVPERIWSALAFPTNLYSNMLMMYDGVRYPDSSSDRLYTIDDFGNLSPVEIDVMRKNEPGPRKNCGYRIGSDGAEIPLDEPVVGTGWWLRMGYLSTGSGPVTVTIADTEYDMVLEPGYHSFYFRTDGDFDSIDVSGIPEGVEICTNDVTLGTAKPFGTVP